MRLTDRKLEGEPVAHAVFMRLRDTKAAEVAFTVADEHQGRGIGPRLLERLAERAAEAGIERFVADVLAENRPMLKVFEEAGFEVLAKAGSSEAEVSFPIAPTATPSRPHRSTGPPRGRRLASTILRPIECCRPRRLSAAGLHRRPAL